MSYPNDRYRAAAQMHLRILGRHHQELQAEDRLYIPYGSTYGLSASEIATETGLPIRYVRRVLNGLI
jgi:hypothetical protein